MSAGALAGEGGKPSAEPQANLAKKKCKKKRKKCKKQAVVPPAATSPPPTTTTTTPPPNCSDDSVEPNDSIGQSTVIPSLPNTTGYFRCPSNSDFFRVSLGDGNQLTVTVTPSSGFDPSLSIYDSSGTLQLGSPHDDFPAGGTETASFTSPVAGAATVYVQVSSAIGSSTGSYQLSVSETT